MEINVSPIMSDSYVGTDSILTSFIGSMKCPSSEDSVSYRRDPGV